jgi:2-polyprenyl-3-methyl-5-hydroxy-6-metoxy-1,4-benzoquinol methylase
MESLHTPIQPRPQHASDIDPYVQEQVPWTNGHLYQPLQYRLRRYPIPELRLPHGDGKRFLDIGCNWGRWSIAASTKGYVVAGIDPHALPITAARRVAQQLGLNINYQIAGGEAIPFPDGTFDVVFSYSVLQHLTKERASTTLVEIRRVLKPGGIAMVQMPNWLGVRSLCHQARRGFRRNLPYFAVHYWGIRELRKAFERIGAVDLSVDGFFGLGIQPADVDMLPRHLRPIVYASEVLRFFSMRFRPLLYVADSVYVTARKAGDPEGPHVAAQQRA